MKRPTKEDYRVNIEFLTWPIIRYKREVLFGWVDLLVSFGGIAGLFLGFSLLSGVEIVYYFTMRAGCMFVKNRVSVPIPRSNNKFSSLALAFLPRKHCTRYSTSGKLAHRPVTTSASTHSLKVCRKAGEASRCPIF